MGKLDITGGDEQKIGYYAGFIVEFISCAKQDEASTTNRDRPGDVRCRNRYFSWRKLSPSSNGIEHQIVLEESRCSCLGWSEPLYPWYSLGCLVPSPLLWSGQTLPSRDSLISRWLGKKKTFFQSVGLYVGCLTEMLVSYFAFLCSCILFKIRYLGVIKSAMGELTDTTNRAEAFALMTVVWALGGTLG